MWKPWDASLALSLRGSQTGQECGPTAGSRACSILNKVEWSGKSGFNVTEAVVLPRTVHWLIYIPKVSTRHDTTAEAH